MVISVVMASFLGAYKNAATNREEKFIRAVNSFLYQDYEDKELVIISDGCDITKSLYEKYFKDCYSILFRKISKQPLFSGNVRNEGLGIASGSYICYLDTDDFFRKTHLSSIMQEANTDWLYWDDYLVSEFTSFNVFNAAERLNKIERNYIGTSSIAHRKDLNVLWGDGYGHDWWFIQQLTKYEHKKINSTGYMVCHVPIKLTAEKNIDV